MADELELTETRPGSFCDDPANSRPITLPPEACYSCRSARCISSSPLLPVPGQELLDEEGHLGKVGGSSLWGFVSTIVDTEDMDMETHEGAD